jgi:hypothetical protein
VVRQQLLDSPSLLVDGSGVLVDLHAQVGVLGDPVAFGDLGKPSVDILLPAPILRNVLVVLATIMLTAASALPQIPQI